MAGVDVSDGSAGRRRSLDSEINMIPMIDLLMVTISFLLITAVWTHMARVETDAQVPGRPPETPPTSVLAEKDLHVDMRSPERFVLAWKQGDLVVDSVEVPRREFVSRYGAVEVVQFPELMSKVQTEWAAKGQHSNPGDAKFDHAVLHTDDRTPFKQIVGVLDAIHEARRDVRIGTRVERAPAFDVVFALN